MDRISNLPNEVLCQILSLFPIKEAACTSVLSKRWRNLFALTPNLKLNDRNYKNHKHHKSFSGFVGNVLTVSANLPLKKFTLKDQLTDDPALINRWICNVLSRSVSDLHLYVTGCESTYSLPKEIFYCKTLVKLKLGSHFKIVKVPKNASLPSLKTLFLGCVTFPGCGFETFISACHVLEELTISGYPWDPNKGQRILCPTLKRLTLLCKVCRPSKDAGSITLDTPSLVYLDYRDYVADEYLVTNLESLVEARLSLDPSRYRWEYYPTNLIEWLSNVEILNLCHETSTIFWSFGESMPLFKNLSRLSITFPHWEFLSLLLKNSPNLETLVIKGPLCFHGEYEEYPSTDYSFMSSCFVRVLEITKYGGTKRELKQMEHFLETLQCLELVKIWSNEKDQGEQLQFTNDLQRLPRLSGCDIQFAFNCS